MAYKVEETLLNILFLQGEAKTMNVRTDFASFVGSNMQCTQIRYFSEKHCYGLIKSYIRKKSTFQNIKPKFPTIIFKNI
jgi:hypothetical protein